MPTDSELTVKVTRHYDAPPERVFDAWIMPEQAGKFLFATPSGEMVRVDINARVGGKFEIVDRRDGEDILHRGEYLELDRPHRLVFQYVVEKYSAVYTKVEIDIALVDGGSELTLKHEIDPEWIDFKSRTEQGWRMILDNLAKTLS